MPPTVPWSGTRAPERALRARGALVLAVLAAAAGCAPGDGDPAAARARHVLLISIDTLRPDFLGSYGHPRATSPNLDALAARGVRFTDATAAAPWTLPSHASMLTGLLPSHHGVKTHETRLAESVETVAESFQAAGFQTLAVVNTHNLGAPQFQLRQGFERFEYVSEIDEDARGRIRTPNTGPLVLGLARELLGARAAEKPFFLFLHAYDVHTDFTPREEVKREFVQPYTGKLTGRSQQLHGMRNRGETLSPEDLRFLREMYEAEIRQFDELLGEFFAWMEAEGLLAETLVVVTSDHGEEFQEHGGLLHGRTQYQEVMRVPFLVAGPGVPAGVVIDEPVHGIDVAPTLLGVMGVPTRARYDGLDVSVLWRGGALAARPLFGEADHRNTIDGREVADIKKMIRRRNEKLLLDTHTLALELYDLAADPEERVDLCRERPERAAELQAELERYLAGAVAAEAIAPPTAAEQSLLDALGYGGEGK